MMLKIKGLKEQYHAILSKTMKIETTRPSVDSSQDIMTKIPLEDSQNVKKPIHGCFRRQMVSIKMGPNYLKTSGQRFQVSLS